MRFSSFTGLRVIFSAILLCVGLSATALSQSAGSTAASITGVVIDQASAVIGGASVSAKNLQTNYTRDVLTGEDGVYLINQLPPGIYEIVVKVEGFTTKSIRVDLILGTTTLLNFTMQVGAATDVIEVTADNLLDEGRTESSTNIDRQRIDNLPINRRNFLDFSLTSARVVTDRIPAFGASATSGLSFNGQSARFNNITIDGLDNNDLGSGSVRSTFSQDAVQEFQVVSDNYSAEFGKAASGLVNIVTRGGGNEFNGNVFFFLRNDEISARDVFAPFEPNYKQYQFGSVLSGPIKKDRAFFFTSFERLSIKQNSFITISDATIQAANRVGYQLNNGPAPFSVGNTAALGRFDGNITPNDTFWVRINYAGTYNGGFEPFGGLVAQGNGGIQELNDTTIAASNTYISAGLNLVNETRFQYGRRNQDVEQIDDLPQVRFRVPEGEIRFGRGTFLPMPRVVRAYQIVDAVSLTRGRHNIKFGGDLLFYDTPNQKTAVPIFPGGFAFFDTLNFSQIGGIPGLPTLTPLQAFDPSTRTPAQQAFLQTLAPFLPTLFPGFPANVDFTTRSLPIVFTQGFGDPSLSAPVKFFSAFFQDDIKLRPNLLIKAGVRYDIGRVDFTPKNNGNLSPRIALSYKPIENLNIKANYGLFFNGSQLIGATFVSQLTSSGQLVVPLIPFPFSVLAYSQPGRRFPNPENGVPSDVNVVPQLTQVSVYDPNLRNSYTQQAGLGISYYIGNNTAVEVDYQYVRGTKLLSARNINPVVRPFSNNPIDNAVFGRVDPSKGDLFEFESAFDSYYHAVTFLVNRRFTNRFGLLAHYTISKSIDNFVDFRFDIQEVVDPLNIRQERGLSLQDVRNRFVASGVWDLSYTKNPLLKDYQLSAIVNAESGRPYNLLAGVDLNRNLDNPQGDRPIVNGASIGRNLGVLPGFASVDLRLSRIVKIKEGYAVQGVFEVFNLFNRVNINDIDRIFPPDSSGNFNLPERNGDRFPAPKERFRSAFGARQFQIGFRVTF